MADRVSRFSFRLAAVLPVDEAESAPGRGPGSGQSDHVPAAGGDAVQPAQTATRLDQAGGNGQLQSGAAAST